MASSPSVSDRECRACPSVNKGGIYCPMCATPRPKRTKVLGALARDDAMHSAFARAAIGYPTAVTAFPTAVAKKAGTVDGAPAPVANTSKAPAAREAKASKDCSPAMVVANTLMAPVAREAKASKECFPAMADFVAPVDAEVVAKPTPVPQAPGPFHLTRVVVEIVGTEMDNRGRSCEEHKNCGEVMGKDMVVRLRKVQIQVEGREETMKAAYWVTDGVDRCHVGFLQRHMVKQAARFDGVLAQVTRVLKRIRPAATPRSAARFIKIKGVAVRQ
jgi:hypothetical protein